MAEGCAAGGGVGETEWTVVEVSAGDRADRGTEELPGPAPATAMVLDIPAPSEPNAAIAATATASSRRASKDAPARSDRRLGDLPAEILSPIRRSIIACPQEQLPCAAKALWFQAQDWLLRHPPVAARPPIG
jgi:hypothetical protein